MTESKAPILLSFYALTNGSSTLLFGQLTYTRLRDLSFKDYNSRKTFQTLFSLYQTKPYSNQAIILVFDSVQLETKTDAYGSFYFSTSSLSKEAVLRNVIMSSGEEVSTITGLYSKTIHFVNSDVIVVSDIDDTLMHSFIFRRLRKLRTLMFTAVENRKAVKVNQALLQRFVSEGAISFYLSNSEQNLYPLIYRFLLLNNFPPGPLFLKKIRSLWDVVRNVKFPLRDIHKRQTLDDVLRMFPDKKIVLLGDNTQQDLLIYLEASEKFPENIRYIIIRKVIEKKTDVELIRKYNDILRKNGIVLHYAETVPDTFVF
jgi:phosphatidate phosphatase APP1